MARTLLTLALFLAFGTGVRAAPVPTPGASPEIRNRFDHLWGKASQSYADLVRLQCYLETLSHKQRRPLLREKLIPVRLTEKQAKEWLKELGSEDEKTWKEAETKLSKFDIRLALDVPTAWDLAETDMARRRLVVLLRAGIDPKYGPLGLFTLTLKMQNVPNRCIIEWNSRTDLPDAMFPKGRIGYGTDLVASLSGVDLDYDRESYSRRPIRLAIDYLERDPIPENLAILERMAAGHPWVGPTLDAKRALVRIHWGDVRVFGFAILAKPAEARLDKLWLLDTEAMLSPDVTRRVLADPTAAFAFLKTKLRPQAMEKAEAKKLLEAYLGGDSSAAQKAFEELRMRDFKLALPLTEAWDMAKDANGRGRLVALDKNWGAKSVAGIDKQFTRWDFSLRTPEGDAGYWLASSFLRPDLTPILGEGLASYSMYNTLDGRYWDYSREEIALVWLEAIDTPEGWECIRTISRGHPKASLTKFAQGMLVNRKR